MFKQIHIKGVAVIDFWNAQTECNVELALRNVDVRLCALVLDSPNHMLPSAHTHTDAINFNYSQHSIAAFAVTLQFHMKSSWNGSARKTIPLSFRCVKKFSQHFPEYVGCAHGESSKHLKITFGSLEHKVNVNWVGAAVYAEIMWREKQANSVSMR